MQPQREIPIEDEPDEAPINEYEINELEQILNKKIRYYLSKTDSKGRGGNNHCSKYNNINKNILI